MLQSHFIARDTDGGAGAGFAADEQGVFTRKATEFAVEEMQPFLHAPRHLGREEGVEVTRGKPRLIGGLRQRGGNAPGYEVHNALCRGFLAATACLRRGNFQCFLVG